MQKNYDRLYVLFVYYFNVERDYFECHEVMEELWLEEGRNILYQGLLQVAVGLYHYRNGNTGGAVKLLSAALEKLDPQPDEALGIDLRGLREESRTYLNKLAGLPEKPFAFYDLTIRVLDPLLAEQVEAFRLDPPAGHED
ncbi:hypothetical protein SAMN02799630_00870 [Paenibacillus sp. UNCCL117]|uniref:DUF309 domain-containing protein n=1 Tax=unclassified Paenibacillus TaxID=185978 RepID=UPI00088C867D|nr:MULTISPECIES: DUF309 domain-containing protein [unclassified Paenibacillus]SDC23455.1 hypothetical protein SAMN04488602_101670 [Paenibacillus sp. cl123]SFW19303.1 hypothetical protein SAMN02799630_00870 [Paenibacillus sp. UNCCL117]